MSSWAEPVRRGGESGDGPLRRLGQRDAARAAYERAAELAATENDRKFLVQHIEG